MTKTNISNYRPISLLDTFSTVIETFINYSISHYLKANNILVPEQCDKLTDCILTPLNQKMHVGEIFYDLPKAFDCVNHEILLIKFCFLALKEWFKSYLTDRK
jgi:hypothetical protein